MKNILMIVLHISSVVLLLSHVARAIPVSPPSNRGGMAVKDLLTAEDVDYFTETPNTIPSASHKQQNSPPSKASSPSPHDPLQVDSLFAASHKSRPKSSVPATSNPPAKPSIDPPIPNATTQDEEHDTYHNHLLNAVELEDAALDAKNYRKDVALGIIDASQHRARAIEVKAQADKHVTAELIQYHINKIRKALQAMSGIKRWEIVLENTIALKAQTIVDDLLTTLNNAIDYYSKDSPKVDKIVWPVPKTHSLLHNSETLINEAHKTRDDLEKLPGEVQREVDACVTHDDLLSLANKRQVNALAQTDAKKKQDLLLVSLKIRFRAIDKKAHTDTPLTSSWVVGQLADVRASLRDVNSEDVGKMTQKMVEELWKTIGDKIFYSHKKMTVPWQVWPLRGAYNYRVDSLIRNSDDLIKQAIATKDDINAIPEALKPELEACTTSDDLLMLAGKRQINALDQKDPELQEALLLLTIKIRKEAIERQYRDEKGITSTLLGRQFDAIRSSLKTANSDRLGKLAQQIVEGVWELVKDSLTDGEPSKKRKRVPKVWPSIIRPSKSTTKST